MRSRTRCSRSSLSLRVTFSDCMRVSIRDFSTERAKMLRFLLQFLDFRVRMQERLFALGLYGNRQVPSLLAQESDLVLQECLFTHAHHGICQVHRFFAQGRDFGVRFQAGSLRAPIPRKPPNPVLFDPWPRFRLLFAIGFLCRTDSTKRAKSRAFCPSASISVSDCMRV